MSDNRFNAWGTLSSVTIGKTWLIFTLDPCDCNDLGLLLKVLSEQVGVSWLCGETKRVDIQAIPRVKEENDDSAKT